MVCSRSLCHHPLTPPVPVHAPGHADSSTQSLSTHRSSCHPPPRSDTSDTQQVSSRKGVFLQLSACRPYKMIRAAAAALYTVAPDQLSDGIFLQTRSSSFKQREELHLHLSPAMSEHRSQVECQIHSFFRQPSK